MLTNNRVFTGGLPSNMAITASLFPPTLAASTNTSNFLACSLRATGGLCDGTVMSLRSGGLPRSVGLCCCSGNFSGGVMASVIKR